MIEFKAETTESLQARYHKALERVWIPDAEMSERPGLCRENVFDSENGIRLIISRDKADAVTTVIHFSGSVTDLFDKSSIGNGIALLQQIVRQFRKISNDYKSIITMHQITDAGIPHYIIR